MSLLEKKAVEVFEAMKMYSAFVDWLKEKAGVHYNNDRVLFKAGSLELLMKFLTRRSIYPRLMTWLAALSRLPIETLRFQREDLLRDPSHCPYSQSAIVSTRALTEEQEQAMSDRLRRSDDR
jgi:hypothetical protein